LGVMAGEGVVGPSTGTRSVGHSIGEDADVSAITVGMDMTSEGSPISLYKSHPTWLASYD